MCKPCFVALAVKRSCANASTRWHPDHDIGVLPPAIIYFSKIVYDLVETNSYKIRKLHFHHALVSFQTQSQGSPYNSTFTNWCVPHPVFSKFCRKSFRYFKSSAILRNILTHQHKIGMRLHTLEQSFFNRVNEPEVMSGEW